MNIKIIADSTCDLSPELIEKYNIRIVPLCISKGDAVLKDGLEITPKDIFDYVESGKGMCSTSAVNMAEYVDVYEEERPKCDAIIHFIISSEMSACYQNALLAAEGYDNIYVIDTRNLSTGIGHLVLDAAEMAAQGMPAEEIYNIITDRIALVDASFVIDTLAFLHKGGRCSAVQALAAGVLKLKPCIVVKDGKMGVDKKYRGKIDAVLQSYIKDKLADAENIDTRRLFITHTMKPENLDIVDKVKAQINEILPFDEVYETTAGGTISCHCGPNTLGRLFFRKA
jgi:DegV family protein with EDD domain